MAARESAFRFAAQSGGGARAEDQSGVIVFGEEAVVDQPVKSGGKIEPGVDLVIKAVKLAERLTNADLCLTGEGAIDGQSAFGKTAVGVARLARSLHCPTLALAGRIDPGAKAVLGEGIDAYFSICSGPTSLDEAIAQAGILLERATEQAVRAFLAGRGDQNDEI